MGTYYYWGVWGLWNNRNALFSQKFDDRDRRVKGA